MLALAVVLLALLVPTFASAGLIDLLDLHERGPAWALALALLLGALAAPVKLAAERLALSSLRALAPALSIRPRCAIAAGKAERASARLELARLPAG